MKKLLLSACLLVGFVCEAPASYFSYQVEGALAKTLYCVQFQNDTHQNDRLSKILSSSDHTQADEDFVSSVLKAVHMFFEFNSTGIVLYQQENTQSAFDILSELAKSKLPSLFEGKILVRCKQRVGSLGLYPEGDEAEWVEGHSPEEIVGYLERTDQDRWITDIQNDQEWTFGGGYQTWLELCFRWIRS